MNNKVSKNGLSGLGFWMVLDRNGESDGARHGTKNHQGENYRVIKSMNAYSIFYNMPR
jgi:hypothetical protein